MRFDFSEEAIGDMYGIYADALSSIQTKTNQAVEQLIRYAQQLRYEPVVKLTMDAVAYYNEDLKNAEIAALGAWRDSDASFTKLIDEMRAGDQAAARSKRLEGDIENTIESWSSIDASSLSSIDTTNWKCDEADFEQIEMVVKNHIQGLEDLRDQCSKSIAAQKSENGIYTSIEPVTTQSVSIVIEGFRQGVSEALKRLADEFGARANKVAAANSNAAQQAASASQRYVSSSVSALNDKIRSIWD